MEDIEVKKESADDLWLSEATREEEEEDWDELPDPKEEIVEEVKEEEDGDEGGGEDDDIPGFADSAFSSWKRENLSGCVFGCPLCKGTFTSSVQFESHLLLVHESAAREPIVVKEATVRCQRCDQSVWADAECFNRHLYKNHKGILLEEYFKKVYQGEEDQKEQNRHQDVKLHQPCKVQIMRLTADVVEKLSKKRELDLLNKVPPGKHKRKFLETLAFNKCQFRCPSCQKVFHAWSEMEKHWKSTDCARCTASEEGVTVKKLLYQCRICHRTALQDDTLFGYHLKKFHGVCSLQGYKSILQGKEKEYRLKRYQDVKRKQFVSKAKLEVPLVSLPLTKRILPPSTLPDDQVTHELVESLCLYKCTKCSYDHTSWDIFSLHVLRCVGQRAFSPLYVAEARYHKCAVCACCILCDKGIIRQHFKSKHAIFSLTAYRQRCQDEVQKRRVGKNDGKILDCKVSLARVSQKVLLQYKAKEQFERKELCASKTSHKWLDLSSAPRSTVIDDLCEFFCLACDKCFDSLEHFQQHRKKGPCKGQTCVNSQTVTKQVAYECSLCQKLLLCDRSTITNHLRSNHRMKRDEYLAKTGQTFVSNTWRQRRELEKMARLKENIPVAHIAHNDLMPQGSASSDSVTLEIGNLCMFRCPSCELDIASYGVLKRHMFKCAKMTNRCGNAGTVFKYCKEARYHECAICSRCLLCDKDIIFSHASTVHRFSRDKYCQLVQKVLQEETRVPRPLVGTDDLEELKKNLLCTTAEPLVRGLKAVLDPSALQDNQVTHAVENLCLFRCLLCPVKETFDKLCSLQTHYAKAHGRQTKVSFGPKFLAEARYHRCWECRRVLLCEKRVIKAHAMTCHKIKSLDYQHEAEAAEAARRRKCGGYSQDWKATTGRRRERLKEEAERLALLSGDGGGKDGGGGEQENDIEMDV